ncbi:hypothetical protein B566_EDAN003062 [Ephemera danica]|nr:hypothetical protein B566_EDAN003062 [Ephemera danica]
MMIAFPTHAKSFSAFSCILLAFLFIVAVFAPFADAKRGCSAFGHSCFGGHGKRSEDSAAQETLVQTAGFSNLDTLQAPSGDEYEPLLSPAHLRPSVYSVGRSPLHQAFDNLPPSVKQWLTFTNRREEAME